MGDGLERLGQAFLAFPPSRPKAQTTAESVPPGHGSAGDIARMALLSPAQQFRVSGSRSKPG